MLLPLMKSGSIAAVLTYEKIFHPNTLTLEFSIINGSQNWMIARLVYGGQVPAVSNLVVKSVSQPLLVPCISLCNRYCSFHGSPSNKCCMWPSANHSPLFADKLSSHHDYIVSSPPAPLQVYSGVLEDQEQKCHGLPLVCLCSLTSYLV